MRRHREDAQAQAILLPMADWPYDQHLLLSDFLHPKGHKFQGAQLQSERGVPVCWDMGAEADANISHCCSAGSNPMVTHSLEPSGQPRDYFCSPQSFIISWHCNQHTLTIKQVSGRNTAGRIPLTGGTGGTGCTVLKHHERVEVATRTKLMKREQQT